MTYIKASVVRPGNNAGGSLQPKTKDGITILDLDKVLLLPDRDSSGVVIEDNIILQPGDYGITIYATAGKSTLTSNTDGETDNEGFNVSFEFTHPGNEHEIRAFKANWLGKNVAIILDYCNKEYADLAGELCNPMKLQVAYTGGNDGNNNVITFASAGKGQDIAMYLGTIPKEEPLAVVPADSASIPLVGKGQYQLTGGASATPITDATGATHGLVFTLLGVTSGTAPIIEDGGLFLLKDGHDWTGTSGSQITFRAFKDGAASFRYIEQSRV